MIRTALLISILMGCSSRSSFGEKEGPCTESAFFIYNGQLMPDIYCRRDRRVVVEWSPSPQEANGDLAVTGVVKCICPP